MEALSDNQFGFDVRTNNPFRIFPYLQYLSNKEPWLDNILDLSRWDPWLWYSPSGKWRLFYSFIVAIDTYLNSIETWFRIHKKQQKDYEDVMKLIEDWAYKIFNDKIAKQQLEIFNFFIWRIQECAKEEWIDYSKFQVIKELFKYSTPVWWTYHNPWWEEIVRIVSASYYRDFLNSKDINSEDFIFTSWVNDAIWTLFKMFCSLWYLNEWDNVAISVPVYYPYFSEINQRWLIPIEIETDPNTWITDFSQIENFKWKIKMFFLVTPWNPSWMKYSKEDIKRITEIAKKHDAIIVSDEIYARFYKDFDSPWNFAKERTIRLSWKSKIERSPWLRFGHMMISKEANEYLSNDLLKKYLNWNSIKQQIIFSKAPWWNFWSFAHTVTVPWPSQVLWMIYNLLWWEDRRMYVKSVEENSRLFFDELWIPYNWRKYYGIFNLNEIPWSNKINVDINEKIHTLAIKYWVILIPAMQFFSKNSQNKSDKSNYVRVSLPNLYPDQIKLAAKRIKEYLIT